jgi:hypothetical protein
MDGSDRTQAVGDAGPVVDAGGIFNCARASGVIKAST